MGSVTGMDIADHMLAAARKAAHRGSDRGRAKTLMNRTWIDPRATGVVGPKPDKTYRVAPLFHSGSPAQRRARLGT